MFGVSWVSGGKVFEGSRLSAFGGEYRGAKL
jgi:hypothetical protein